MSESTPSTLVARALPRVSLAALVELTKPSIAGLVMVTAFSGALAAEAPIQPLRLLIALVATAMVVGAANTLNMYWEVESDALMRRTARRPLPSGRLSPEVALGFGLMLASLGLNVLGLSAGGLPCALTLLAFVSYVFVYTPLKRVTPHALTIGALPGALPPLIGYAAVEGSIGLPGLLLFAILFVWQLPHFLAIAVFREADYRRAGMKVLSVVAGAGAAERSMKLQTVLLVALSLLPSVLGVVHPGYLAVVLPTALAFGALVLAGPRSQPRERWARRVFFASMPYLVIVCAAFVAAV